MENYPIWCRVRALINRQAADGFIPKEWWKIPLERMFCWINSFEGERFWQDVQKDGAPSKDPKDIKMRVMALKRTVPTYLLQVDYTLVTAELDDEDLDHLELRHLVSPFMCASPAETQVTHSFAKSLCEWGPCVDFMNWASKVGVVGVEVIPLMYCPPNTKSVWAWMVENFDMQEWMMFCKGHFYTGDEVVRRYSFSTKFAIETRIIQRAYTDWIQYSDSLPPELFRCKLSKAQNRCFNAWLDSAVILNSNHTAISLHQIFKKDGRIGTSGLKNQAEWMETCAKLDWFGKDQVLQIMASEIRTFWARRYALYTADKLDWRSLKPIEVLWIWLNIMPYGSGKNPDKKTIADYYLGKANGCSREEFLERYSGNDPTITLNNIWRIALGAYQTKIGAPYSAFLKANWELFIKELRNLTFSKPRINLRYNNGTENRLQKEEIPGQGDGRPAGSGLYLRHNRLIPSGYNHGDSQGCQITEKRISISEAGISSKPTKDLRR